MFDDVPEFAIQGERGIDILQRLDDPAQKRARYRCVACVRAGHLADYAPEDGRDPARLLALAEGLAGDPQAEPLSLADSAQWPRLLARDPVTLFLRLDFLRHWATVELSAARFETQFTQDAALILADPGKLVGAVVALYDLNRLGRAVALAQLALPPIEGLIARPGFRDHGTGSLGYALRMLGDLALRADEGALALRCFEASVAAGDNPFRRRRAIEAARAANLPDSLARHRAAYAAQWPLPADLAEPAP